MPAEPLVASIALNDRNMPDEARLLEALGRLRPELGAITRIEHKQQALVFSAGGDTVAVSLVPDPIDWSELEESCEGAWYWPGAADALRGHVAHVLIAVQPEVNDRLRAAMLLTAVAAAVASTTQAAGVYWSASGLVHSPDAFVTYAQQMRKDSLPLLLWIDFELRQEDDGTCSVYTTGLREFNQMEIEVHSSRRDPQWLLGRVFDVAHYLLEKNVVLHDGETVGTSSEEKIPVTIGSSGMDPATRVILLGL